jgi:hypothetical protein
LNSGPTPWVTPPALFMYLFNFFLAMDLVNNLPGLASNLDPPDLCLLSR